MSRLVEALPGDWPPLLTKFAAAMAEAAAKAREILPEQDVLRLTLEPGRLEDGIYREELLNAARTWRARSDAPTIYVMSYPDLVPQELLNELVADAKSRADRSFSQTNRWTESRCLYVGHSFKLEQRLKEHLGYGHSKTSALNLRFWPGHPADELCLTAHRLPAGSPRLIQLLEDFLWDELKPLLGKRGGK